MYLEDVDFDGAKDLIISSNLEARDFINNNFQRSIWFYKNTGTVGQPSFTLQKQNFLQDEMIEVGDYASPALVDMDGDNDLDLFIGTYSGSNFTSSIVLFENTGSAGNPEFKLISLDYLGFSFGNQYNLKIQFADLNADGKLDLTYSATDRTTGTTALFYLPNNATIGLDFSSAQPTPLGFQCGRTENAHFVDIDQDGLQDILLGKSTGSLQYWRNIGTGTAPRFSLIDGSFLGIENDFDFQNMALFTSDLDADGRDDIIIGTGDGFLKIFGDFRMHNADILPASEIIYNNLLQNYGAINFGGVIHPIAGNIFNSDKPAILIGTVLGGVMMLKNDEGQTLPEEPQVDIFPNPVAEGESLFFRPDRNVLIQVYTLLGQKLTETYFVPANQQYPLPIHRLSSGMYIARISFRGKSYGKKFIVR